ncbi:DUF294 nucleotidyltransferase-like domain-containing protein [Cytobacillus luteolus]|nr:DUF294 nucleotidyltransferase-like domain-containing protein [Cytobacillus luteolus]MBP1941106.1 CBS domain-containing protein [Cytobacillus luteolus]
MVFVKYTENSELEEEMNPYLKIRQLREKGIYKFSHGHRTLNHFHDQLMKKTVQVAIEKVESEFGPVPALFAFFTMGSAARSEQSIWSDQDHGLIFAGNEQEKPYFLQLGTEISKGLHEVGYEYCDGNVMASNMKWCHSIGGWEKQLTEWLDEASWESLRYFTTFFDSRVLLGEEGYLRSLKETSISRLNEESFLYSRLLENISHVKKGIGVLGQFLPDIYGKKPGHLNSKDTIFFPYVNSIRLLALKEAILDPSTINRFEKLPLHLSHIKSYQSHFERLLELRLLLKRNATNYEDVHYVKIDSLSKFEKQELKQIMKKGYKLFNETKEIILKGCRS